MADGDDETVTTTERTYDRTCERVETAVNNARDCAATLRRPDEVGGVWMGDSRWVVTRRWEYVWVNSELGGGGVSLSCKPC